MERQNTGRINTNLTDSGVAGAGSTIRNCMIARLVVLAAGAFSSVRAGDKHLAAAFDVLLDPALRQEAQMPAAHRLILQTRKRIGVDFVLILERKK